MPYSKETKLKRIQEGYCSGCFWRIPENGFVTCSVCRGKDRERRETNKTYVESQKVHKKQKRTNWISTNVCSVCGKPKELDTKLCIECLSKKAQSTESWRNKPRNKNYGRMYVYKTKLEGLAAYGGKCNCCGETNFYFLELDHVYNNGNIKRRAGDRTGAALWAQLKRQGYPKDEYQLLCANCNQGKNRNNGVCPHKEPLRRLELSGIVDESIIEGLKKYT